MWGASLLNEFDIKNIFYDVKSKLKDLNISCSNNVEFYGMNEEKFNSVILKFNKSNNTYYMTFSKYFTDNEKEKIEKMFLRYFITTNEDQEKSVFKTNYQIKKEIKNLPFEYHLEATYRNSYLNKKIDDCGKFEVMCCKCKRIFTYDDINCEIYDSPEKYKCNCGGKIKVLINGKKHLTKSDFERYTITKKKKLKDIQVPELDDDENVVNVITTENSNKQKQIVEKDISILNKEKKEVTKKSEPKTKTVKEPKIKQNKFEPKKPTIMILKEDYENCSEENFKKLYEFSISAKKITNKQMIPMLTSAIDDKNIELINMLNTTYGFVYWSTLKYLKKPKREYVSTICTPIYKEI